MGDVAFDTEKRRLVMRGLQTTSGTTSNHYLATDKDLYLVRFVALPAQYGDWSFSNPAAVITSSMSSYGNEVALPWGPFMLTGQVVTIKRADADVQNYTVVTNSSNAHKIDGQNTYALPPYGFAKFMCDGANWLVLN